MSESMTANKCLFFNLSLWVLLPLPTKNCWRNLRFIRPAINFRTPKLFELHINWPEHQIRKVEEHIPSSHGAEENNKAIGNLPKGQETRIIHGSHLSQVSNSYHTTSQCMELSGEQSKKHAWEWEEARYAPRPFNLDFSR